MSEQSGQDPRKGVFEELVVPGGRGRMQGPWLPRSLDLTGLIGFVHETSGDFVPVTAISRAFRKRGTPA